MSATETITIISLLVGIFITVISMAFFFGRRDQALTETRRDVGDIKTEFRQHIQEEKRVQAEMKLDIEAILKFLNGEKHPELKGDGS